MQQLLRLVQKLSLEAEQASRIGGRREIEALQATAKQYLKLYDEMKARGDIEGIWLRARTAVPGGRCYTPG